MMLKDNVNDFPNSKAFLGKGWRFPVNTDVALKIETSSL